MPWRSYDASLPDAAIIQRPQPYPRVTTTPVDLTIIIPALNEEQAIGSTIERTLAARDAILQQGLIGDVNIVVVSDGSTDRTVEIAKAYMGIDLVVFPVNRGYGAAIKAGWEHAPAELLSFLDADGTCDPMFFIPMCRAVLEEHKDLVLGGRMGSHSKMPIIRRIGNTLFSLLLGYLSKRVVSDTASGMRVVRRSALPRLLPLPDGLHFTPAMSARALMDGDVSMAEIDMPYAERVGRSKLRVIRDGVRFLAVILSAAAYIRVSRLTLPIMTVLAVVSAMVMRQPTLFYLHHGRLEEWMFYRFAFAGMLGTMLVITVCATIVSEHVVALTLMRYERFGASTRGLWRYETLKLLVGLTGILGIVGVGLNWSGVVEVFTTSHVTLHWSRVMVGAYLGITFTLVAATLCTLKIVRALNQRQPFLSSFGRPPDPTESDRKGSDANPPAGA